jgi:hypothetical protein
LTKKRLSQINFKTETPIKRQKVEETAPVPQINTTNINNNNIRLEMSKAYIANNFKGYSSNELNNNFGKDKIIIQNILQVNDGSASQNNKFHVKLDITNININGNQMDNKDEKYEKVT